MMEYTLEHYYASISTSGYIDGYRDAAKFMAFCRECGRYGTCWACPPFGYDPTDKISAYKFANITGTKISLKGESGDAIQAVKNIIIEVRKFLDDRLLSLEKEIPGSLAFFAGTCHRCPDGECTRGRGLPCLYPESIRPSLEAFGFDIGLTTSSLLGIELKWAENGQIPDYITLVSGLFTDKEILPAF